MPDRRRRAALSLPLPAAISGRTGTLLLRGRRPASGSPSSEGEDNPFAPPPEDRPDQPWQPRRPQGDGGSGGSGDDGDGSGDGSGEDSGSGDGRDDGQRDTWGQWSSRQPAPHRGGFGTGQGGSNGEKSGPERPGTPGGMRWDPTDPVQRRARYALLSGMWAFFFALFNVRELALLLGALALYWGISSLRGKAKQPAEAASGAAGAAGGAQSTPGTSDAPDRPGGHRPQATAAISGLVTGSIALALVAALFSMQLVYRDYYTCVNDSLTQASRDSCEKLLPEQLRPLLEQSEQD